MTNTNADIIVYEMQSIQFANQIISRADFNEKQNAEEFNHAKFVRFAFIDLQMVNVNDPNFWNADGIRTTSDEEKLEQLKHSLKKGWNTSFVLPSIDVNGNFLNGRSRTRGAIENGEKYMAVAVYERNDDSKRNLISDAISANTKNPPSQDAKMADFIAGAVHAWSVGELAKSSSDILDFLFDCGVGNMWDTSSPYGKGIMTKLVNKIFDAIEKIESSKKNPTAENVVVKSKSDQVKYCRDAGYNIDDKNIALLQIDYAADAARFFSKYIGQAIRNGNDPVKFIGFSHKSQSADEYDKCLKDFVKAIDNQYNLCFEVAGVSDDFKEFKMQNKPYEWLGVVPQIANRKSHMRGKNFKSKELVSMSVA